VNVLSRALSPEDVFRLHPKIRWTAYSVDGKVVFCQMRAGLQSYTSDAEDRAFMELGPLIMSGVAERLTPSEGAGKLESVIVNLGKDSVLLTRSGSGYLAVSVDRADASRVFQEIEPLLRKLH
jgi:hypothetical protein